ncbi:MAG TPA: hypothetical protein VM689_13810 [Aliidongia sp.]|nr:hypothetical protein [Aliidongia sp.]
MRLALAALCGLLLTGSALAASDDTDPHNKPVKVVADQRLTVTAAAGTGQLPLYVSADWTRPQPGIIRALLVFHGKLRDADVYLKSGEAALAAAGDGAKGTLLIVPQFLDDLDMAPHELPAQLLHWGPDAWMGGEPAHGPAALSSFEAIDAILARLADRSLFPALQTVVVAGHSGGGQVVQRYAVVGKGETVLTARGIHVRYLVANPSSYVYFSKDRPVADDGSACPGFDRWKYGFEAPPPYVEGEAVTALETRYVARDVVYLLGGNDIDPNHAALDKSCEAEVQGPYRLARGHAYFAYLQARHPGLTQQLHEVPGVGHEGAKMLGSACGLAALFDLPGCSE